MPEPMGPFEYQRIAEAGTILRCLVGSGVHGLAIEAQDDRDEMGICIEPPEYVIGLRPFDQYIYRSQPEGHRSGPGDLDLTVYSLLVKIHHIQLDTSPFENGIPEENSSAHPASIRRHNNQIVKGKQIK